MPNKQKPTIKEIRKEIDRRIDDKLRLWIAGWRPEPQQAEKNDG